MKNKNLFLVEEQLSDNIFVTKEGFLFCKNVCIARVGIQEYTKQELPNDIQHEYNSNDIIQVYRNADELFSPETIASYNSKVFTLEHPNDAVDVTNFKKYCIGFIQNVRPDDYRELLLADILVIDEYAIDLIVSKKVRGISCGYSCNYIKVDNNKAIQTNIRGNHISLVKNPRGGDECIIKDSKKNTKHELSNEVILKLSNILDKML